VIRGGRYRRISIVPYGSSTSKRGHTLYGYNESEHEEIVSFSRNQKAPRTSYDRTRVHGPSAAPPEELKFDPNHRSYTERTMASITVLRAGENAARRIHATGTASYVAAPSNAHAEVHALSTNSLPYYRP